VIYDEGNVRIFNDPKNISWMRGNSTEN